MMGWSKPKRPRVRIDAKVSAEAADTLKALQEILGARSMTRTIEKLAELFNVDPESGSININANSQVAVNLNSQDSVKMPSTCRQLDEDAVNFGDEDAVKMPSTSNRPYNDPHMRAGMRGKDTKTVTKERSSTSHTQAESEGEVKGREDGAFSAGLGSIPLVEIFDLWGLAVERWNAVEHDRAREEAIATGREVAPVFLREQQPDRSHPGLLRLVMLRWTETPDLGEWKRRLKNLHGAEWVVRDRGWNDLEEILKSRPGGKSIWKGLKSSKKYRAKWRDKPIPSDEKQADPELDIDALSELERIRSDAESNEDRSEDALNKARALLSRLPAAERSTLVDALSWAFRRPRADIEGVTP